MGALLTLPRRQIQHTASNRHWHRSCTVPRRYAVEHTIYCDSAACWHDGDPHGQGGELWRVTKLS